MARIVIGKSIVNGLVSITLDLGVPGVDKEAIELGDLPNLLKTSEVSEVYFDNIDFPEDPQKNDAVIVSLLNLRESSRQIKLFFTSCSIPENSVLRIAEVLKSNKLISLKFEEVKIKALGAITIANNLVYATALYDLTFGFEKNSDIDDVKFFTLLGKFLKENSTLNSLHFVGKMISDEAVTILANSLKENEKLAKLGFTQHAISGSGAAAIVASLKENSSLKDLSFLSNDIADQAATAFYDTLSINESIAKLELRDTNIGSRTILNIAAALQENKNSAVERLFLGLNIIKPESIVVLGQALQSSSSIKTLDLTLCHIGDTGIIGFIDSLSENNSMTELMLAGNNISDVCMEAIAHLLSVNDSLQLLDLSSNSGIVGIPGITNVGVALLHKALLSNMTITELPITYDRSRDSQTQKFQIERLILARNKLIAPLKEKLMKGFFNLSFKGFRLEEKTNIKKIPLQPEMMAHIFGFYCNNRANIYNTFMHAPENDFIRLAKIREISAEDIEIINKIREIEEKILDFASPDVVEGSKLLRLDDKKIFLAADRSPRFPMVATDASAASTPSGSLSTPPFPSPIPSPSSSSPMLSSASSPYPSPVSDVLSPPLLSRSSSPFTLFNSRNLSRGRRSSIEPIQRDSDDDSQEKNAINPNTK